MTRTPPIHLPATTALLAIAAAIAAVSCSVAPSRPSSVAAGEKIYRQTCANCHGAQGQGVEGKYKEALAGDWAQPRLARYIAKNMPDDDPATLSATEADTVAAFVFDSFYSRAAQSRHHPARIEIAHLTNRQYAVTIADLLRQVGPPGAEETPSASASASAHGLNAIYYNVALRGRFDNARAAHRGIDPQLDFQFTKGGAARARASEPANPPPPTDPKAPQPPSGFSVQWRGSIVADETGDHEFIIRTPNSVRVWINAEPDGRNATDAALDVNVSNPLSPDHRVTLRLLGGRSYPIAIDYWALPEKVGSPVVPSLALRWKPPHGSERTIPARNLSPAQVAPTFVVSTRFPADDSSQGYERSISVSKAWDEATTSAAFEVANHIVKRLDHFAGTRAGDTARPQKIETFAARFVTVAFRRPLAPEELKRNVTDLLRAAPDAETGLRRVVLLALKSPHFLYVEVPASVPDANRIATRLAFTLWDSAPDAALAQATTAGRLRTREEVSAQATRLLADPRARAKVREFFQHWLQLRFVEDLAKDAALFPDFTPEVIDDLRASVGLFVDDVVWSERSDFRELLRSEKLFVSAPLAQFYGLPSPPAGAFAAAAAPAGQRSGVLTHPYLLAALSYKATSSPIHRGVFLTRSIVGRALKPPPQAQTFDETSFEHGMTMREKVTKLTRSDNCQGCHAVINPLGFSLENFDAVGRYRTTDQGRPIDAASDYADDENPAVRLASARDVADFALANQHANEAFIEQLFHHLVKQSPRAYGPETLVRLRASFIASGYHLRQLMAEIATLAALHAGSPP